MAAGRGLGVENPDHHGHGAPELGSKWELWHRYAGNLPVSTPATDAQAEATSSNRPSRTGGAQHPSSGWNTPARGYTLRTRGSSPPRPSARLHLRRRRGVGDQDGRAPGRRADGLPPYYVDQTQWQMGVLGYLALAWPS